jgi:hypothetical protein
VRRSPDLCANSADGRAAKIPPAAGAVTPLRAKAEAAGLGDFSPMWSGQAAALGRAMPAGDLTKALVAETERELPPRWREHIGRKQRQRLGGPRGPREAIK